jgi:hypothetical protein
MAGIGAILGIASSVIGFAGAQSQAKFIEAQAKNEQQQLNRMSAEEKAVASRDAQAKSKETSLLLSRQQAVAAASGAGATDPTVLELAGDLAKEGNVQSRELMRQGLEKGQMLEYRGTVGRQMAKSQAKMTRLAGWGSMIGGFADAANTFASSGGTSAFGKYGGGMPTGADLRRSSVPSFYG